jgi:hypothetical protein
VRYLRFVVAAKHKDSGVREGVFQAAGRLARAGTLSQSEQARLDGLRAWFGKNLDLPDRFTRTRNASHKRTRGIAWFKDSAKDHLQRMRELVMILGDNDVAVDVVETERPGYVTYEDDVQIVAEPFSDTGA